MISGASVLYLCGLVVCWCGVRCKVGVSMVSNGRLVYLWFLVEDWFICEVSGCMLVYLCGVGCNTVYLWCFMEGWCVFGGVW